MPSVKRGGNPEKAGLPPCLEKGRHLSLSALCVSGRYPKKADKGGEEGCSFSHRGLASQEREGRHITNIRCSHERPDPTEAWGMAAGGEKGKKDIKKREDSKRGSCSRNQKGGYPPGHQKGGDVSAFEKELYRAVGDKADEMSLVSKRTLEVRDLEEPPQGERLLPRSASRWVNQASAWFTQPGFTACRLYKHFGGVQTAVVRFTQRDARSLLGLGKLRVRWVNCRIREHVVVAAALGARDIAMCNAAARFQAGRMPAGGVRARRTWPRSVRLPLDA